MLSGCIFAEPPVHTKQQTAPVFNLAQAQPPINEVLKVSPTDAPVSFIVPFRSEDAGETVYYALHRNYGPNSEPQVRNGVGTLEPSTYSDDQRQIRITWSASGSSLSSCFPLTLVACHQQNFLLDDGLRCAPDATDDTALATWWVNYGDVDDPATLADCVLQSTAQ